MAAPEANLKIVPRLRVRYCPIDSSTCYGYDEEKGYCAYCERTYPENSELAHPRYANLPKAYPVSVAVSVCPNDSCRRVIVDDAARFCPGCGSSLADFERSSTPGHTSSGDRIAAKPQVATQRHPPQMAVVLAVGIICLIVALVLLNSRDVKVAASRPAAAVARSVKQVSPKPPPRPIEPAPPAAAPEPRRVVNEPAKKPETIVEEHVTDTTEQAPTFAVTETATESLPPPVREGDLVSIEDADVHPMPISPLHVTCPQIAIRMRWTGTTELQALISAAGVVEETRVLKESGKAILDAAAVAAMRMRRYRPAVKDGVSVKTWILVEINFDCARRL